MRTEKPKVLISMADKTVYDFAGSCPHKDGEDGIHISLHAITGSGITNLFLNIDQAERLRRGLDEALNNHFRKVNS